MKRRTRAYAIVLAAWGLVVLAYAYAYVSSKIALPSAEGYERDWTWQLFFFSIVRLPFLVLLLLVVLLVMRRLVLRRSGGRGTYED